MAAGAFTFYDIFSESLGDGTQDLDTHTFNVALFTNSYTPNAATDVTYSSLTNQVANSFGYTTGGIALTGVTWAQTGGVATFDATLNPVWTASGGSITARYAVLYNATSGTNNLIGYFLLEDPAADVTATTGNTLTITWNASGIFTVTA